MNAESALLYPTSEPEVICASADEWRRVRLAATLEQAGYAVRTCSTPRELLYLAATHRPFDEARVLLLDAELSDEIAPSRIVKILRQAKTSVRTVLLADLSRETEIIECLRVGADDFVCWPAEPAEIIEVVGRVIALPGIL